MKILSFLTVSVLVTLGVFKNTTNTATPPDHIVKMNMLIKKQWKLTDETTFAKGTTANTFKDYTTCVSDDLFTFYANGSMTQDDNREKCATDKAKITNGIWAFNIEDKNKLEIALSMQFTAEIVDITETTLIWKYQNQVGDIVTQTYTKQ